MERQKCADEEFCRVMKHVKPLNKYDTCEDLEGLDSVIALDASLRKDAKQAQGKRRKEVKQGKPRRGDLTDVNAAILQLNIWKACMKYE
jgi:Asp-tRNA(Asn)/Glu-tRNA(Gln) amidotransferase C subunit